MGRGATISRLERLDRLQGILKARDTATVGELASELEVSARSLYRDLDLLRSNGVPIEADRGRGGGIRLERRWSLGRMNLDDEEAIDLLLSMAIAEQSGSPLLLWRLRTVRQKLSAAFSDAQQVKIRRLRNRILIGGPASERVVATYQPPLGHHLAAVKSAFFDMRRLRIEYRNEAGVVTSREVEPQFLYLNIPVWYLLTWDHLRDAIRCFRVDRLVKAEKLDREFRLRDPKAFLAEAEQAIKSL